MSKNATARVTLQNASHSACAGLRSERQQNLLGPEDDMWATFADMAEPYEILIDGHIVGCCSIDDDNQLHAFHVSHDYQEVASEVLAHVIDTKKISAAVASTVDPAFLSLSLTTGGKADPVALMYTLIAPTAQRESVAVRPASRADHCAAVEFYQAEIGLPRDFLERFLAERVDRGELYLVEGVAGEIAATGECRVDPRSPGHAHLGLVVGAHHRGRRMGSRLMHTLTELSRARGLTPLCSTEPANIPAQRVIHRAGFRCLHRVFRIAMMPTQ
ncbi:GNAT family N-acetyltransferase [Salinispora mooreana]|uniref:GNAT family N-acetyltransferase n=1 Tax=Salinispora mooreana TaxID=999545 RepID=UPI0009B757AE|nr:GNAT family N-acetyltransferase [Salinispora mooreana]